MTENPGDKESDTKQPEGPPALVPPDATGQEPTRRSRIQLLLVLACGLLLVVGAVAVLFWPPLQETPRVEEPQAPHEASPMDQPSPVAQQPVAPPGETTPEAAAPDEAIPSETAPEANRLLGEWLKKQAVAEAENITAWGGKDYSKAVSLARDCDRLLGEQQFVEAQGACKEAIAGLDRLMAEKRNLLDDALRTGFLTLENGDPEGAAAHFQRALAIEADNQQAQKGLRRAARLPEVLRLVEAGQAQELAGDAQGALKSFSKAASLDPDFRPARKGLSRVRADISEKQFRKAMSRALQALDRGDLAAAGDALARAQAVKGGDPALADLKKRLYGAQLNRNLETLRREEESLEKSERWREALSACEQALTLDPGAAFASSCRERANRRIELDSRLESILARPERLFEDGPLNEARTVLARASELSPRGSRLRSQLDRLTQLIREAAVDVEVQLISDGLTEVVIYHVGRLGRFHEKRVVLRTGDYTATGSRNGFRDVRQTLKVRSGSGKMVFTLRCEEPI